MKITNLPPLKAKTTNQPWCQSTTLNPNKDGSQMQQWRTYLLMNKSQKNWFA